jgi:hypothetical protein
VEKLLYVGWKPADVAPDAFRATMLGPAADALVAAGARGVGMLLADDRVVAGLRIARSDPTAVVSLWVDSAVGRAAFEAVLRPRLARLAGWRALESVPLRNTTVPVATGERLPGLYTVAFLEKPDALDHDTWLARWQGEHTAVALATQRTFLYVQNLLVLAVTEDAPPWTAIVEEAFPAEAATDPFRFYAADTPAALATQQGRMTASCERFIDFARFETIPMSAYVLRAPTF